MWGSKILQRVLVGLTFLIGLQTMAQTTSIRGVVEDNYNKPIPFALVILDSTQRTSTNESGIFEFQTVSIGSHTVQVQSMSFATQTQHITAAEKPVKLSFSMKEDIHELGMVVIETESKAQIIQKEPFALTAIDVEPLKSQNLDVNQVLNTSTGVRIRQEGGLGSDFNFSLNGFSGNQVKFFIDGVPMDNFGSSLTLNNIPVNLISRIEVYKGVVPVHLGSDALGGAINVETNKGVKNFADIAYSFGSFNTHRTSAISRYTNSKTGVVVNTNAFFNYSDNDYEVEVSIPDPNTGKYGDPEKVKRFHDAYQSQTLQLEAGVSKKHYANQLFMGAIVSGNYKEIQTGSNMTKVAGEVYTKDKVFIPYLKYQKYDLFTKGLSAGIYTNFNNRKAFAIDTSSKLYDWRGNFTHRQIEATAGELNWDKTQFRFNDQSLLSTANLSYELDSVHSFSLNNTYSRYTRVGEDPISYNAVPFSEPSTLTKNVSGLAYTLSLFSHHLKSVAFAKHFYMHALSHEGEDVGDDVVLIPVKTSGNFNGYGFASTYFLRDNTQIKVSYENTYRLPEAYELFGNGLLLLSSPHLTPEKSKNFNVGVLARYKKGKHEYLFEAEYLYRLPTNMIRLVAVGVTSSYENLATAKANIYEGGIKYAYNKRLHLQANATYQNIVNNQKLTPTGGENYLYLDQLPNRPFLFGNLSVGAQSNSVGHKESTLSINWSTLFVEAFYLKWPSQGNTASKYDVPRQISHDISTSYSLKNGKYSITLSCTNLLNSKLFDNFMLQKPGRAFSVKMRYFFSK